MEKKKGKLQMIKVKKATQRRMTMLLVKILIIMVPVAMILAAAMIPNFAGTLVLAVLLMITCHIMSSISVIKSAFDGEYSSMGTAIGCYLSGICMVIPLMWIMPLEEIISDEDPVLVLKLFWREFRLESITAFLNFLATLLLIVRFF